LLYQAAEYETVKEDALS